MQNINNNIIISVLKLKLQVNEPVKICAEGYSMLPIIENYDYIKIFNADNYFVGDIVLYECRDRLIVHRIIYIEGSDYIIMGDNSPTYEDKIRKDNILGKVLLVEKNQIEKEINNYRVYNICIRKINALIYKLRKRKDCLNDKYYKKMFIIHQIFHFFCGIFFLFENKRRIRK